MRLSLAIFLLSSLLVIACETSVDLCENDPTKTKPGICGCGNSSCKYPGACLILVDEGIDGVVDRRYHYTYDANGNRLQKLLDFMINK